jgi:O-antigen/teichoic acid export membrane protein
LSNGMARFYHESRESKRSRIFSTSQIAMVGITLIITLTAILFAGPTSRLFFKSSQYSYLISLAFLTIPLSMITIAPMMRLRLEEKARLYATINVFRVATGVILNIILIVILKRGLNGLFEGPLMNAAFYAIILSVISIKDSGLKFSKEVFNEMFKFSYPFIFGLALFWILNWADRFILARMTNLSETGLYTLGYTMGMVIMLPVGAFNTAWPPFFMSIAREAQSKKIYSLVLTYYTAIMAFLVLIIAIFSRDYFYFFTPEKFHGAYIVVPLITAAYALNGSFSIVAVGSIFKKKPVLQIWAELSAVIINIILMFVLIPFWGRIGAAWATLGAYLVLTIVMYWFSNRVFSVNYEFKRLAQITIISLLFYWLITSIYQPTITNLILRLVIVMIYPLGFLVTGFFSKGELRRINDIKNKIFRKKIDLQGTIQNQ